MKLFNLTLARRLGIGALTLAAIQTFAFVIGTPGWGRTSYEICKRKRTMINIRRVAIELIEIQKRTGDLPSDLSPISVKSVDAWGTPLRYWTDGLSFNLASVPGSGDNPTELGLSMTDVSHNNSYSTDYFQLRPEIIIVGELPPDWKTKPNRGYVFYRWPIGRNAAYEEGPFGIGSLVGWWICHVDAWFRG